METSAPNMSLTNKDGYQELGGPRGASRQAPGSQEEDSAEPSPRAQNREDRPSRLSGGAEGSFIQEEDGHNVPAISKATGILPAASPSSLPSAPQYPAAPGLSNSESEPPVIVKVPAQKSKQYRPVRFQDQSAEGDGEGDDHPE